MTRPGSETKPPDGAGQDARQASGGNTIWCRDHHGVGYSFDEALDRIRSFHGHAAPGLVIGMRMVDLARARLPAGILFDAVCETTSCLPDAVQMLTPCTVGNGWLRILDLGKFALALYDKSNGRGFRVSVDVGTLAAWPHFRDWFLKRKSKAEQDVEALLEDLRQAGADALALEPVELHPTLLAPRGKGAIGICPHCGEAFPRRHGDRCRGCQGRAPYRRTRGTASDP